MANDDKNPKQSQPTLPTGGPPPPGAAGTTNDPARARTSGGDMVKLTNEHTASLGLPPVTRERAKQLGREVQTEHLDRFLTPGENTIPREHWDAVKDQSPVRNWIEAGMLYEGSDRRARGEPSTQTYRESLAPLRDDEAQRYIDASTDVGQLSRWSDTERRPAVRDAIQRRMDALGAGK